MINAKWHNIMFTVCLEYVQMINVKIYW